MEHSDEWYTRLLEVVAAFAAAERSNLLALLGCTLAAGALLLLGGLPSRRARAALGGVALAAAIGWGARLVYQRIWLCDDAFISFRYARNLYEGHGLVFNVGEWVEGYTNFLWTVTLAAVRLTGLEIPSAAVLGGIVSWFAVLALTALIVARELERLSVPVAAIALAVSPVMATWATSGLETMPATALVLFSLALGLRSGSTRRLVASGVGFALAAMTRPDHLLFGLTFVAARWAGDFCAGGGGFRERVRGPTRNALLVAGPLVAVFGLYFALRWHAYGDLFPNTYYAKSGGGVYWSQGSVYVWEWLLTSGAWLCVPLVLLGLLRAKGSALAWFCALAPVVFATYVAKTGGDFMQHRFLVVLLPVLAIGAEAALRRPRIAGGVGGLVLAGLVGALALALAAVEVRVLPNRDRRWLIADEPTFYPTKARWPPEVDSPFVEIGLRLKHSFTDRGADVKYAHANVGIIGYLSRLPMTDANGLITRRVGHKEIKQRGIPGHEKTASLDDYLADEAVVGNIVLWPGFEPESTLVLDGQRYALVQYDETAWRKLAAIRGAQLPPLGKDIAKYVHDAPLDRVAEALAFYQLFLKHHPGEEKLLAPLRARLARAQGGPSSWPARLASWDTLGDVERVDLAADLLSKADPDDPSRDELSRRLLFHEDFEGPRFSAATGVTGDAWGEGPVHGTLANQQEVAGANGTYASSYVSGDARTGVLRWVVPIHGRVLVTARVGGGSQCDTVHFRVSLAGRTLGQSCGLQDERLRTWQLIVEPQAPGELVLEAVDAATGAWGHLLVDQVMVLDAPKP